MAFSATRAALEGFRVIGRRPVSILVWTVVYTLVLAAIIAGAILVVGASSAGDMIAEIATHPGRHFEIEEPEELWPLLSGLGAGLAVLVVGSMILTCVQMAAVFRAVIRPKDRGFAFMQLGGDEILQFILMIVLTVIFTVVTGGLTLGLVYGLKSAGLDEGPTVPVAVLGSLLIIAITIILMVRLSLAPAMTFSRRSLDVFGSWGLTRGRFWPLVGMYILAAIFICVVGWLGGVLADFAGGLLGFSAPSMNFHSEDFHGWAMDDFNIEDWRELAGTGCLVWIGITMLYMTMQIPLTYAPQARAYLDLTARDPEPEPEAHSAPPADDHGHDHPSGGDAAALAAGAAAAGAAVVAASHAHAEDHGHGDAHAAPAEPHPEPAFPVADTGHADHGHSEAHPAADHGHGDAHPAADDHGHSAPADDHSHAAPAEHHAPADDHGHHEAAHPAPAADDHGHHEAHAPAEHHAEPAPAEHHADPAHAEPHAEPHGEAHGETHGDGHHDAHAPVDAAHAEPEAHPAESHPDPAHPEPPKEH